MNNDISIILNVYKRPHTLEKQINNILNQSVKINPNNIHVWYNYSGKEQYLPKNKNIKTYSCNWNTKFHGRFTIPLLCRTEYIAIFDDDVICGKNWLENCLKSIKIRDGIYGGSGVVFKEKKYEPFEKFGWNGNRLNETKMVDLVGHAWFFKQKHTKLIWSEEPISWDNGEDIMFSYLAKKNGINTYVPPHPQNNVELWSNVPERDNNWGSDENASWLQNKQHYKQRNEIVGELIKRGWKTVNNV